MESASTTQATVSGSQTDTTFDRKKKAPDAVEKDDDNYKYVSEETVQSIVFMIYTTYKRALALAKDIVLVRNLYNTAIVSHYTTLL